MNVCSVTVPCDLARFADNLGMKIARFREHNRHRNNLETTPEQNIKQHILGTRGEAGLYYFFGGRASGAVWDVKVRYHTVGSWDISYRGHLYDAKGVDCNTLALCCYPQGVITSWRYVLVGTEHWPDVLLLGWCTGADILTTPLKEKVIGRAAYFIEQHDTLLRSCLELLP